MAFQLLTTKLYIPPPRPNRVSRPRLVERIGEGLHRAQRLTLVSAPAGSGKTTLLIEWAAQTDHPVAWLSLDEGDNDPTRFLLYVIAALQTIDASLGEAARAMLTSPRMAGGGSSPSLDFVLTSLINDLAGLDRCPVLVLDDAHRLAAPPVHQVLDFLLDHTPESFHLIIATRSDPPLNLARLRGRGQLTELRQADLRFTPEEATQFLNQSMDLGLTGDQVTALASRTEGWAAGLQMAAVSMQDQDDVDRFIQAFAGSNRYVIDYLVSEVLQRRPPGTRDFLLQTSILDRLCAPLCDAVRFGSWEARQPPTGEESQVILDALEAANLFIVPLDQRRVWYRYHQLFADLLRHRLERDRPGLAPTLHLRASEWYAQNGFVIEAIEHALAGEAFERAAELIQGAYWATLFQNEGALLRRWLTALPDELVHSRPGLCLMHAWAELSVMALPGVERRLEEAEGAIAGCLRDPSPPDPAQVEGWRGEIATLRATLATFAGDIAGAIELSHQALAYLPAGDAFLRGLVTNALGTAYEYRGDVVAAGGAFEQAVNLCRQAGNVPIALIAMNNLGRMKEVEGRLRQAGESYRRALAFASEQDEGPLDVGGLAHVGLGRLRREWNNLEDAVDHLEEGVRSGQRMGNAELETVAHLGMAEVHHAQGNLEAALAAVERAGRLAQERRVTTGTARWTSAYRARLWIAEGRLVAAGRWARDAGLDAGDPASYQREGEHLVLARLLVARGEPGRAVDLLGRLLSLAEDQGRVGSAIQIGVLLTMALWARGEADQAVEALGRVLPPAERGGYVRIFVDEGEPMARTLRRTASTGVTPGYVEQLLSALGTPDDLGVPGEGCPSPLVEPLTARELEVLDWVAAGLSNREIAGELVITVGTVKWHTNNIYGKLQVSRRTEAVARAQELGLL